MSMDMGLPSWQWMDMPLCKQKLVDNDLWDPVGRFFRGGAHMPLYVVFGEKGGHKWILEISHGC